MRSIAVLSFVCERQQFSLRLNGFLGFIEVLKCLIMSSNCVQLNVRMYVCMSIRTYVCEHYMCIHTYVHTYVHVMLRTYVCTNICVYVITGILYQGGLYCTLIEQFQGSAC